jgi:hypothetical protein
MKCCATCRRWARLHGRRWARLHGRYGRCALPRTGPKPYWWPSVTKHDQLDTADIHGADCAAYRSY